MPERCVAIEGFGFRLCSQTLKSAPAKEIFVLPASLLIPNNQLIIHSGEKIYVRNKLFSVY
jgi:hypothetical protein